MIYYKVQGYISVNKNSFNYCVQPKNSKIFQYKRNSYKKKPCLHTISYVKFQSRGQESYACTALKIKQDKTEILQICDTDDDPCKGITCHHMKENMNGPATSQIFKTAKLFLACSGSQFKRSCTHQNMFQTVSILSL